VKPPSFVSFLPAHPFRQVIERGPRQRQDERLRQCQTYYPL
jgi:hypothetical protein